MSHARGHARVSHDTFEVHLKHPDPLVRAAHCAVERRCSLDELLDRTFCFECDHQLAFALPKLPTLRLRFVPRPLPLMLFYRV